MKCVTTIVHFHCCPVEPGGGVPKLNPELLDGAPKPNVVGVGFAGVVVVVLSTLFAGGALPNMLVDRAAPNANGVVG